MEFIDRAASLSIGLLVTLALGAFVPRIMKWVRATMTLSPPDGVTAIQWSAVTDIGDGARKVIRLVGVLEQALFFLSLWLRAYELAGGWLIFKAASKWETWQSIMKVPESPPKDVDPWSYLAAKNQWASATLQRWLLGVLLNGAAAAAGVAAGRAVASCWSCCR
jgi:hypothetical protein